jgi:hypothetical protein
MIAIGWRMSCVISDVHSALLLQLLLRRDILNHENRTGQAALGIVEWCRALAHRHPPTIGPDVVEIDLLDHLATKGAARGQSLQVDGAPLGVEQVLGILRAPAFGCEWAAEELGGPGIREHPVRLGLDEEDADRDRVEEGMQADPLLRDEAAQAHRLQGGARVDGIHPEGPLVGGAEAHLLRPSGQVQVAGRSAREGDRGAQKGMHWRLMGGESAEPAIAGEVAQSDRATALDDGPEQADRVGQLADRRGLPRRYAREDPRIEGMVRVTVEPQRGIVGATDRASLRDDRLQDRSGVVRCVGEGVADPLDRFEQHVVAVEPPRDGKRLQCEDEGDARVREGDGGGDVVEPEVHPSHGEGAEHKGSGDAHDNQVVGEGPGGAMTREHTREAARRPPGEDAHGQCEEREEGRNGDLAGEPDEGRARQKAGLVNVAIGVGEHDRPGHKGETLGGREGDVGTGGEEQESAAHENQFEAIHR